MDAQGPNKKVGHSYGEACDPLQGLQGLPRTPGSACSSDSSWTSAQDFHHVDSEQWWQPSLWMVGWLKHRAPNIHGEKVGCKQGTLLFKKSGDIRGAMNARIHNYMDVHKSNVKTIQKIINLVCTGHLGLGGKEKILSKVAQTLEAHHSNSLICLHICHIPEFNQVQPRPQTILDYPWSPNLGTTLDHLDHSVTWATYDLIWTTPFRLDYLVPSVTYLPPLVLGSPLETQCLCHLDLWVLAPIHSPLDLVPCYSLGQSHHQTPLSVLGHCLYYTIWTPYL